MKALQLINKKAIAAVCLAVALPIFSQAEPQVVENHEHCAGPAQTFHDGMPPPRDMEHRDGMMPPDGADVPPFLHGLKLSEAQEDKMFVITHAAAPLLREQAKRVHKSADDMRNMMTASSQFDEGKFKSLAETNAHAMAELMILRARNAHQIYAILTPEQRTQAEARRTAFEEHAGMHSQAEEMHAKGDAPH